MNIKQNLEQRKGGMLFYGLTPPKKENSPAKNIRITQRRIQRIRNAAPDGLVIYDIQDEASRHPGERPFPFLETVDPDIYALNHLKELTLPKVVYLSTGKYTGEQLKHKFNELQGGMAVMVGAPSSDIHVRTSLKEAYALFAQERRDILLGGVAIAERHQRNRDEHLKMLKKMERGVKFFISQCVYDAELFKDLLSDYKYEAENRGISIAPVIMTLTPCGSTRTLSFIKWLGIKIPRWMENDLIHKGDILNHSLDLCLSNFRNVYQFCQERDIPIGFNIESVAISKEEVMASFKLAAEVKKALTSTK